MKYGLTTLALVLIAGAVAYAAVQNNMDEYSWNYRITVNIETPEGFKGGSAVRQVVNRDNTILGQKLPDAGARISAVKGEAVVIDLGKRGVVFGLIEHGSYGELYSAFSVKNASNTSEDFDKLQIGKTVPLPKENWPMFVTFTDINDPLSVELVYGWKFNPETQKQYPVRRFEEIFGENVQIKDVTIEIVEQPSTWGTVDKYLNEEFWSSYRNIVKSMNIIERAKNFPSNLFQFKLYPVSTSWTDSASLLR